MSVDCTTVGITTAKSGADNRTAFVDWLQTLNHNRGETLYWPTGLYNLAPIDKTVITDQDWARYVSFAGDGYKSTWIQLSEAADYLFDWSTLRCFDVYFRDMTISGNNLSAKAVWRFDSGGEHYRVTFQDIVFRDSLANGLDISNSQLIYLRGASAQFNDGWGFRFAGVKGIFGDLDPEFNGTGGNDNNGGVIFENSGATETANNRSNLNAVITGFYQEGCDPAVKIVGVSGVNLLFQDQGNRVILGGGANANYIHGNDCTVEVLDDDLTFLNRISGRNVILKRNGVDTSPLLTFTNVVSLRNFRRVPDAALPSALKSAAPSGTATADATSDALDLGTITDGFAGVRLRRTGNCKLTYNVWDYDLAPTYNSGLWDPKDGLWYDNEAGHTLELFVNEGEDETIWLKMPTGESKTNARLRIWCEGQGDPNQRLDIYSITLY